MSSIIFANGQRIIRQVLSFLQTSLQDHTTKLVQDVFQAGIDNSTSIGEGFTIKPGDNNTIGNPSISISDGIGGSGSGIAYDINSSRIFIDPADVAVYNSAAPSTTTDDGLGNLVPTPQSTGTRNISLTQSSLNYLWVNYVAVISQTDYTLHKIIKAKQFYRQTDGYKLTVTTVLTPPDAASIFLGTIDLTTGTDPVLPGNISEVGRIYFGILPKTVSITTALAGVNPADRTPVYDPASTYTLQAHIKAVGTGTVMTPTNPHKMSLADLGVSAFDTVNVHRQLEHGNAVIAGVPGTPYPTTSAMASSINVVNPGSDTLNVYMLLSTEFAIVNGAAYNVNDIFGAIPANATISFPSVSGTYNVYWNSTSKTFGATTGDISGDVTKLWIATATYTYVGTGILDHNALSALIDRRRVGSTSEKLQRWITNARPGSGVTAPISGEFGFNLTTNLLEYWDGSAWQQPVNTSSNALVPTGTLLPFAGAVSPAGFLMADGTSHLTASYPDLFAVIGYTYGGGGGNFSVPNMTDRAPIGAGSIASLGSSVGASTHTLSTAEIPVHNHAASSSVSDPGHFHGVYSAISGAVATYGFTDGGAYTVPGSDGSVSQGYRDTLFHGGQAIQTKTTGISVSTSTSNAGSGNAHSIVQPSIGLNYIIKH